MAPIHSLTKRTGSLFFSDFVKLSKEKQDIKYFFCKLGWGRSWNPDNLIVGIWIFYCLSNFKESSLQPYLKNSMILNFIHTLKKETTSFDRLFQIFLIDNWCDYDYLPKKNTSFSISDIRNFVKDVLRYAFAAGIQYPSNIRYKEDACENLIDLPLTDFSVCKCSSLSRPLYIAMYHCRPDIVRLLLNCGARVQYEDECVCTGGRNHPLKNVLDGMKSSLKKKQDFPFPPKYIERCILCLRTLLVDLAHTSELNKLASKLLSEISGTECTTHRIPRLMHITRYQIRLFMKNKRLLCNPRVFEDLGLPHAIVAYLNVVEEELAYDDYYKTVRHYYELLRTGGYFSFSHRIL